MSSLGSAAPPSTRLSGDPSSECLRALTQSPSVAYSEAVDRVALAHDYVTQRGGAERVVAIMADGFPDSPLYTTLYDPDGTFEEFRALEIHTSPLNRLPVLRHHHRLAFPLLAPAVDRMRVDADVLIASSSGWAHAIQCTGRKIVYCHAPARWLYQTDRYLGSDRGSLPHRARRALAAVALGVLGPGMRSWDLRHALSADSYLVNSSIIQRAVRETYGIEAEVLPPPPAMLPGGEKVEVPGVAEPFVLCVARLLPYKNVDVVIKAVRSLAGVDLVIVGRGPDEGRLRELIGRDSHTHLIPGASEEALRWLYASSSGLVAASFEDFGLTPLEAASFGKPTAALHAGGYLDTIDPEVNGVFFGGPTTDAVAEAVRTLIGREWSVPGIRAHAAKFGRDRFVARLKEVVSAYGG